MSKRPPPLPTYRVLSYQTGDNLVGVPSPELVRESEDERTGTGAVPAYCDEHGVWQYVLPCDEDAFVRAGHDVISVWTERLADVVEDDEDEADGPDRAAIRSALDDAEEV